MRYDDPERPQQGGVPLHLSGAPLPVITLVAPGENGTWLACIHASRGGNRFGYHSGVLRDLGDFGREWLEDPEGTLERYFQYKGPEEERATAPPKPVQIDDLWGEGG